MRSSTGEASTIEAFTACHREEEAGHVCVCVCVLYEALTAWQREKSGLITHTKHAQPHTRTPERTHAHPHARTHARAHTHTSQRICLSERSHRVTRTDRHVCTYVRTHAGTHTYRERQTQIHTSRRTAQSVSLRQKSTTAAVLGESLLQIFVIILSAACRAAVYTHNIYIHIYVYVHMIIYIYTYCT